MSTDPQAESVARLAQHYARQSRIEALAIMDPKADAAGSLARFTHYAAGGRLASETRKPVETQVIIYGERTVVAIDTEQPVDVVLNSEVITAAESDPASLAYQRGIKAAVQALRWLASARREYCRLCHLHLDEHGELDPTEYWGASEAERTVHTEHATAEGLADIIEGSSDGAGFIPSWLWGNWREVAEKLNLPALQIDID